VAQAVVAVGVLASVAVLGAGAPVGAESCPVFSLVACPGSPPAPPATTTTTAPSTTTTTTVAQQTPAQARERLVALVNTERSRAGVTALSVRVDITEIASRWSDAMAAAGTLSHDDDYFTKESHDRLGALVLGENVARAADVDQAHRALMASEHHRANILDARFSAVGIGATYRNGMWWLSEDFLQPRPARAKPAAPSVPRADTPRAGDRTRAVAMPAAVAVTSTPSPPAEVAAVSAAHPHATAVLPRAGRPARPAVLAGEGVVDGRLRVAVVALAILLVLSMLAVRWAGRRVLDVDAPIAELGPAPDGVTAVSVVDETPRRDVLHRLALIDAWVRTLDDRWVALSESDKRMAMQIIRRNTQAAIDEMPQMMPVSV
jgi:hypothetical protein